MNLFRSEEHVKRWSLYQRIAEDYILPVTDWAQIFSRPLFHNRLSPDYLENAGRYLEDYHLALKELGKNSPYWQYPFIGQLDIVKLSRYCVIGNYTRFEESALNSLKDAYQNIMIGFLNPEPRRDNHMIWAAPGSGKSYFVQQIARTLGDCCSYVELNMAKISEAEFHAAMQEISASQQPILCLLDEIDARPDASWPYEMLLPFLDSAIDNPIHSVFVMAGSSGYSMAGMKERMGSRPKGNDLLSRIPAENEYVIPPMSFGDRILVVLSQFVRAGKIAGRDIRSVEKLGLYYIALNSKLANPRQLYEFAIRAVDRGARSDDRIKYDQLFVPGDPENKRFWLEVSAVAGELINSYVIVEE